MEAIETPLSELYALYEKGHQLMTDEERVELCNEIVGKACEIMEAANQEILELTGGE